MKVLSTSSALERGYSADKRRRRRQHRQNARELRKHGGSAEGPMVAAWHLYQARWLGR